MRVFRSLLLLSFILAFASGCQTVKGWFGGDKSKALEPAELTDIGNPIAVRKLWSSSIGNGEDKLDLSLRPVLDGGRTYVIDDNGVAYALDASTGKSLWKTELVDVSHINKWLIWRKQVKEAGLSGGPAASNGLVVIGGRNGEVFALDADTGHKRWQAKLTSEVISTPLITSDRVVVRTNDGRVFGLDPADGTRKWVFDRGLPTLSVRGNGAPVQAQDLVLIGYDDGSVVALGLLDGAHAWEQIVAEPEGRSELDRMADIDGEIQVSGEDVYAVSYHGQTMSLTLANGRPLWNRDIGSYSGLALQGDKVLVADSAGTVWALDRNTGGALWKQTALARRWLTTPVVQGDYAVVGDFDGYLHWLKLDTGEIVGRARVEHAVIRGTPQVSADGVLYVLTTEGKLAAFRLGR